MMDDNINEFLDRVSAHRMILRIKSFMNDLLLESVFEPNDSVTRKEIENRANAFLRNIRERESIKGYFVRCDGTNNPPSVVENNEIRMDTYVMTKTSSEFFHIPSRVTVTRSDHNKKYDNAMKGIE